MILKSLHSSPCLEFLVTSALNVRWKPKLYCKLNVFTSLDNTLCVPLVLYKCFWPRLHPFFSFHFLYYFKPDTHWIKWKKIQSYEGCMNQIMIQIYWSLWETIENLILRSYKESLNMRWASTRNLWNVDYMQWCILLKS